MKKREQDVLHSLSSQHNYNIELFEVEMYTS